jgi:putative ABC transport system ATP-binding protein
VSDVLHLDNDLLHLNEATFTADKRKDPIIKPITMDIYPSDFVILLGSNGSGKSSLLKMMNGRYPCTGGLIELEGKALDEYKLIQRIRSIGQSARENLFYGMTIYEHAKIFLAKTPHAHQSRQFFKDYLHGIFPQLGLKLNQPVDSLSGGEQQILILALTLLQDPDLILLDEHTAAMDPKKSDEMMKLTYQMIHDQNITCVMTTHNLDHALKYGNRLIALDEGRVILDLKEDEKAAMTRDELVERCYQRS